MNILRNLKVTVFGGTGFVGRHLIKSLCDSDCIIKVTTRNTAKGYFLQPLGDVGQISLVKFDISESKNLDDLFISLKEKLNLNEDINLIESYDISHLSGRNALAGQVTYSNKGKVKELYKIYNISSKNSGNDIGSMQEVMERRYTKINNVRTFPSLILIYLLDLNI